MNANAIKSQFKKLSKQYSESLAFDMLVEKYPDHADMIDGFRTDEPVKLESMPIILDESKLVDEAPVIEESAGKAVFDAIVTPSKKAKRESKKPVEVAPKAEKPLSKAQQAYTMFVGAEDRTRKTITKRFVDEIGLTTAGANTYYMNVKKKFETTAQI